MNKITPQKRILRRVLALVAVFILLATLAIVHDGYLFGHTLTDHKTDTAENAGTVAEDMVDTTDLCKDVLGFGGPVPVRIYISDGRIDSVRALPNKETPHFFGSLEREGLTHAWDGKTLDEAAGMDVDAVSGATYSSKAYIANVRAGAAYALDNRITGNRPALEFEIKWVIVILVILCGAILPLFIHDKRYRMVQLALNTAVLGFWGGTFIDYAMMLRFFAYGAGYTIATVITVMLLIVGILYPLSGRLGHYCAWVCPFGSLQELASRTRKRHIILSRHTVHILERFRLILWVVLMILLYTGWGASWIDGEIFTAFVIQSASWIVIITGAIFVGLSVFVPRAFCRFVCPTGTLLKFLVH